MIGGGQVSLVEHRGSQSGNREENKHQLMKMMANKTQNQNSLDVFAVYLKVYFYIFKNGMTYKR